MPKPPGGRIPRNSDPTKAMIVIKESRSLFLSEHLNSRPAGGYCCSFYKSNSNLPKCPRCQIKAVSRLKCCRHDFQKKRALQPFSCFHPPSTSHSTCFSFLISVSASNPQRGTKVTWRKWSHLFSPLKIEKKSTFGQELIC